MRPDVFDFPDLPGQVHDGFPLSFGQTMALRVAVSNFLLELDDLEFAKRLGPVASGYKARLREVERLLIEGGE